MLAEASLGIEVADVSGGCRDLGTIARQPGGNTANGGQSRYARCRQYLTGSGYCAFLGVLHYLCAFAGTLPASAQNAFRISVSVGTWAENVRCIRNPSISASITSG